MSTHMICFAALCTLSLADVVTTLKALARGGHEANPMMAWAMGKLGALGALVVLKALLLVPGYYCLLQVPLAALIGMLVFYVAIVANNLRCLSKLK